MHVHYQPFILSTILPTHDDLDKPYISTRLGRYHRIFRQDGKRPFNRHVSTPDYLSTVRCYGPGFPNKWNEAGNMIAKVDIVTWTLNGEPTLEMTLSNLEQV